MLVVSLALPLMNLSVVNSGIFETVELTDLRVMGISRVAQTPKTYYTQCLYPRLLAT